MKSTAGSAGKWDFWSLGAAGIDPRGVEPQRVVGCSCLWHPIFRRREGDATVMGASEIEGKRVVGDQGERRVSDVDGISAVGD